MVELDGLINSAYRAGDFKEIEDSDFSDWHRNHEHELFWHHEFNYGS